VFVQGQADREIQMLGTVTFGGEVQLVQRLPK